MSWVLEIGMMMVGHVEVSPRDPAVLYYGALSLSSTLGDSYVYTPYRYFAWRRALVPAIQVVL